MFKIMLAPRPSDSFVAYDGKIIEGISKIAVIQTARSAPVAFLDITLAQYTLETEIANGDIRFNVKWPDGTLVCTLKPEISEYVDGPNQWFVGADKQ